MAISKNSVNDRLPGGGTSANPTDTAAQNYDAIKYGNRHGHIAFGQIHKPGDVTSAIMLQTSDAEHSFFMDEDGQRKGWTSSSSPGNFQLTCGEHTTIEDAKEKAAMDSLLLHAANGNIIILASNGKIRMEADDIELVARGSGSSSGNVKINASENVYVDANKILMSSTNHTKICSTGKVDIIANSCLKLYGALIRGVTDACSKKDSKVGGQRFQQECVKSGG